VKTIPTAIHADGIVLDPKSNHLFVINGGSGSVTVIDPATDAAIKTIDVGGDLEFAAADGTGKLYVDGAERKEIVRIDTESDQVDARWPIPNCTSPHGITIDPRVHRLFASCVNKVLVVVDTETGATVSTLPIGARTDAAAFDAKRKLIFSSNGEGSLSIIAEKNPSTFVSLATIPTVFGARTMALDPESGRIYLVAAEYTINDKADPSDIRHRYVVTPGTVKLVFLDPTPKR
jgi:YVTN family beta-propeller protein